MSPGRPEFDVTPVGLRPPYVTPNSTKEGNYLFMENTLLMYKHD